MRPSFMPHDFADGCLSDLETVAQIDLTHSGGVKASNLDDIRFSDLGIWAERSMARIGLNTFPAKDVEAVLRVLRGRDDFQIADPIVGLVPVDVVDLHFIGNGADESCRDEAMNFGCGSALATIQADAVIAVLVPVADDVCGAWTRNVSEIGNAITGPAFNLAPLFNHQPNSHHFDARILH